MKDDRVYLHHILEHIQHIEEDTAEGREAFMSSRRSRDAVLRNLHTLTESTQRLSNTVKDAHPEVAWREISAFRNIIVHDYLAVDAGLIWDVVERDIPRLQTQIRMILEELGDPT